MTEQTKHTNQDPVHYSKMHIRTVVISLVMCEKWHSGRLELLVYLHAVHEQSTAVRINGGGCF